MPEERGGGIGMARLFSPGRINGGRDGGRSGRVGFGMATNNLTALLWRQEWRKRRCVVEDWRIQTVGLTVSFLARGVLPSFWLFALRLGLCLVLFRWEATCLGGFVLGSGHGKLMA
jgi:hypothetical protein